MDCFRSRSRLSTVRFAEWTDSRPACPPKAYKKAHLTAIVAQQLYGSGVNLRPGQMVQYIITDAKNPLPNDRVRAYPLWEGWQGYDLRKYGELLEGAFNLFETCHTNCPEN